MWITKEQADEREQIIFHRDYEANAYRYGGICEFENLPYETVQLLIEKEYLSMYGAQNSSPTTEEFMEFVETHNPANWQFEGYSVSPERSDVRVTITGINSKTPCEANTIIDFLGRFRFAEEIDYDNDLPLRCWYD